MTTTASLLLNRLLGRARLKHLQVLVKVADLGSLKKAGEAVGMTQPAVTHVVADLEALLGVELFVRHARGVTPSLFGEELLPMARQVIQSLGLGMEAVVARMERVGANLRVGATTAAVSALLAKALPTFMEHYPEILVHVVECHPDELASRIQRGDVDLAVYRKPAIHPSGWDFVPLMADRLVVVCGGDHPMARRRRLTFKQLSGETWLAAPVSTLGRRLLDDLFLTWNMAPRYVYMSTVALPLTCAFLVQNRLLTLIPHSVLAPFIAAGQLAVLPVGELMPIEPLGVLIPQEPQNSAIWSLVDFLIQVQSDDPARLGLTGL